MSDPRILILGAPGAGKGTQSKRLCEAYDIEHVTTGDALRANKHMETEYGTPAEYMDAGDLVPDPLVNEIVVAALEEADGFVLDGYPRNESQVEFLADATDLDVVLYLDVSEEELVDRLTGRRVCPECGASYHVEFNPPAEAGVCDECGADLVQRDDDTEETVRDRLETYRENTEEVIDHYRGTDAFVEIDGEQTPDEVWADVKAAVDSRAE
ncbi:adenylate kinase [Halarchaeum nitratireducens]|uniref:Adenylate kinase n=1 Tax=Halarchaeum nitratireducens TaxID=489913 RepID=A0A830G973_9EURY|nr:MULTISPECIES: adenylate kinase [Halarchaeum]MBP2251330.1 adenylate kinase [Halarchaeum solikamskense]GGN07955.1 adenylate kinase [Halarchaeum nitratireducens]